MEDIKKCKHLAMEETVIKLCEWIKSTIEKDPSGQELTVLPEVISATAKLAERC